VGEYPGEYNAADVEDGCKSLSAYMYKLHGVPVPLARKYALAGRGRSAENERLIVDGELERTYDESQARSIFFKKIYQDRLHWAHGDLGAQRPTRPAVHRPQPRIPATQTEQVQVQDEHRSHTAAQSDA
jgi:hypothetical protein